VSFGIFYRQTYLDLESFEPLEYQRLILSHRIDLQQGNFLVDDYLKNGAAEFEAEHIHFGTSKFPN
jgi:5'(3')-deoxyribonucleotidase